MQIYENIFTPNGGYSVCYPSNIIRNTFAFTNWIIYKPSLHLARKYATISVCWHNLFQEVNRYTVFLQLRSRKTVSYEEQIMSKDKFPSMFSPKWRILSLLSLKYFLSTQSFENWGMFSGIPQFKLGVFGHMTCFDQLCMTTIKCSLVLARDYSVMQLV